MLHSMTGYGSISFNSNNFSFDIELKTLNSKFFDSKISLPSYLTNKEIEIANILKKKLFRGKVDLKINSKSNNSDSIKFNKKVIRDYFKELNEISDFDSSQLLKAVVNLPNSIDKNERNFSELDLEKFFLALDEVIENVIVVTLSKKHSAKLKDSLNKKINDLMVDLDKNRLEQEVIYYLEKIDINEEIVRLQSHISYFNDILNNDSIEKGKKLGFICQEIGREINTIGSKANNSEIQSKVVEMKTSLEKIREQVLNIV